MKPEIMNLIVCLCFLCILFAFIGIAISGAWRTWGKKKFYAKEGTPVWVVRETSVGCRHLLRSIYGNYEYYFGTWKAMAALLDGEGEEWAKAKLDEQKAREEVGK